MESGAPKPKMIKNQVQESNDKSPNTIQGSENVPGSSVDQT